MPGKTPRPERELPPEHTAPPWDHGAGAYHPHVERPPWLDDQAFDAEVENGEDVLVYSRNALSELLIPKYFPSPIVEVSNVFPYQGQWYDLYNHSWHLNTYSSLPIIQLSSYGPCNTASLAVSGPCYSPAPSFSSSFHLSNVHDNLDFVGVRIEGSIGWIMQGLDINFDLIYFIHNNELVLFTTPPSIQEGVTGGAALSGGLLWGNGRTSSDYTGVSFIQGMHTPPMLIPLGEIVVPVPGVELERSSSTTSSSVYFGISAGLETGLYEEMSPTVRLWHMYMSEAKK